MRAERSCTRLPLIVGALLAGGGLSLAAEAGALPGVADAWNLVPALVPLGLAIALTGETASNGP